MKMPNINPNAIDVHVGSRLKLKRMSLGLSLRELAEQIGVTTSLINKYEDASVRIPVSNLWNICKVLEVDISYFYQDMSEELLSYNSKI